MSHRIPFMFYLKYWLKYSIMASATGAVLVIFLRVPLPWEPVAFLVGFVAGQAGVWRYFKGSKRGRFELDYKEVQIQNEIKKVLIEQLGRRQYYHLRKWGELGEMNWYGPELFEIYEKLLISDVAKNDRFRFLINLHAGKIAKKRGSYDKALAYLREAVAIQPNEIVTCFTIGECFEKQGEAENAMSSYKAGSQDSKIDSPYLRDYVLSQIERIKTQGPRKKPPVPWIRYGN